MQDIVACIHLIENTIFIAGSATPLHRAASSGKKIICKLLVESGADVNKQDGDGKTALQRARLANHLSVVELLIEHGAV